jgi:hypothetical protein
VCVRQERAACLVYDIKMSEVDVHVRVGVELALCT